MQYCIYLRKSRADAEAEQRGEGETLARHEKALTELARRMSLPVTVIHREIVSGETIAARPVMQKLLREVEQGLWDGVLVMEVERLARGDTIDQGIVARTFKYSDTKIITPMKVYNPNDEFDEEYFEFGLFMSRREYKTINRRLQRGRLASVKEGKWAANKTPYGYERVRIDGGKGFMLRPIPREADTVRLIFELYTRGELQEDGSYKRLGATLIARRLNEMHIPSKRGGEWTTPTVRDLLINPVYIGKVRWNFRPTVKNMVGGHIKLSNPRSENYELCDGLHEALISEETFAAAQESMAHNPPRPVGERYAVRNPLAGLIVCGCCGRKMTRRPYPAGKTPDTILCQGLNCKTVSSYMYFVEARLLDSLRAWLEGYKLQWRTGPQLVPKSGAIERSLEAEKREADKIRQQTDKAHDLLEQGIYDTDTFLNRSRALSERSAALQKNIADLERRLKQERLREASVRTIIPKTEQLLEVYDTLPDARSKNDMLKEVIAKAVYTKTERAQRGGRSDNFTLELYPRIPTTQ